MKKQEFKELKILSENVNLLRDNIEYLQNITNTKIDILQDKETHDNMDYNILFVNGSEIDIEKLQFELNRNYSHILINSFSLPYYISNYYRRIKCIETFR